MRDLLIFTKDTIYNVITIDKTHMYEPSLSAYICFYAVKSNANAQGCFLSILIELSEIVLVGSAIIVNRRFLNIKGNF